jgi:transcriptional regulator with XRE-family HTH domain
MAGEQLRELMRARGVTAVDIADRIGVSKNTVTNWTKGHTPLIPSHVLALAEELAISIDELAGRQAVEVATGEQEALLVLQRLLESAGALRAVSQAAPNLLDVLRDAEETVRRQGGQPPPRPPLRRG